MRRVLAAENAARAIITDLSDRRGLGNEWDQIDEDVREHILETWTDLILREFKEVG